MRYYIKDEGKEIKLYGFDELDENIKEELIDEEMEAVYRDFKDDGEELSDAMCEEYAVAYLEDNADGFMYDIDGFKYYLDEWDVVTLADEDF